ncbi:MAG: methyltransferase domain-containing protein [Spirochaetes bacterium]|nr:MAG: methyltransferase domain-containing protein [Spirochaetota bacterium]
MIDYFKALSDTTRFRLLNLLMHYELNVNEITAVMDMGQPRISRHLKILTDSGLLSSRRDGLWVFYSGVKEGDARRFIDAITYLFASPPLSADIARGLKVIEARTAETRNFFNGIADAWDAKKSDLFREFDIAGKIIERVPRCTVAADLGCGTGDFLQFLKQRADRSIGVDNSPRMLEMARQRFSGDGFSIDLRLGEMEHLPMSDGEADFALMNMVLHHLVAPEKGIREAARVMKKKSTFIVVEFEKHASEALRSDHGDRWLGFDASQITRWLRDAEFSIRDSVPFPIPGGLSIRLYHSERE